MSHKLVSLHIGDGEYYTRIDADNVIAEKDAEIARFKDIRKVHVEAIESMGAGLLQDYDEIRHQKYKRCLAMAKWCDDRIWRVEHDYAFWQYGKDYALNFYKKWRQRWLKIAEKFKPNPTINRKGGTNALQR